jgi:hypothetical protein
MPWCTHRLSISGRHRLGWLAGHTVSQAACIRQLMKSNNYARTCLRISQGRLTMHIQCCCHCHGNLFNTSRQYKWSSRQPNSSHGPTKTGLENISAGSATLLTSTARQRASHALLASRCRATTPPHRAASAATCLPLLLLPAPVSAPERHGGRSAAGAGVADIPLGAANRHIYVGQVQERVLQVSPWAGCYCGGNNTHSN